MQQGTGLNTAVSLRLRFAVTRPPHPPTASPPLLRALPLTLRGLVGCCADRPLVVHPWSGPCIVWCAACCEVLGLAVAVCGADLGLASTECSCVAACCAYSCPMPEASMCKIRDAPPLPPIPLSLISPLPPPCPGKYAVPGSRGSPLLQTCKRRIPHFPFLGQLLRHHSTLHLLYTTPTWFTRLSTAVVFFCVYSAFVVPSSCTRMPHRLKRHKSPKCLENG